MWNHEFHNFYFRQDSKYLFGSQWQKLFKDCFFLGLELVFLAILDNNNVAFPIFVLEFLCQLTGILTRINDFFSSVMLTRGNKIGQTFGLDSLERI